MYNNFKLLIFTLFATFITFGSCNHDDSKPFEYQNIQSLTSGFSKDNKYLFVNRLAFSKLLAKALKHVELRDYIYRLSKNNTNNTFNEIIFALHKDDIVEDQKTLKDYIVNEIDDEIAFFYKDDFIDKILEQDPMLTIKLPDIFYEFDWDTNIYSPMVYAKTLNPIGENNLGPYYIGYHFSGYQDKLYRLGRTYKFSLVVKYSEDYILLNTDKLTNHQGLGLQTIFPQYLPATWLKLKDKILSQSYKSPSGDNVYYIKKRILFDYYKNLEDGRYRKFIDTLSCGERCLRDCSIIDSSYNIIGYFREKFDLVGTFWSEKNYILQENMDILMLYNEFLGNDTVNVVNKYLISGFRRDDYIDRNIKIDFKPETQNYDGIGEVLLPYIYFEVEDNGFKKIQLDHLVEKGWNSAKNGDRDIEFFIVFSEELVFKYRIGIGKINDISDEYFFRYEDLGNEYIEYCYPPLDYYAFGNILSISYLY